VDALQPAKKQILRKDERKSYLAVLQGDEMPH